MTKPLIAYARRLVAFSASDVVEFGLVVPLLMCVFDGLELPVGAAVAVGISRWLVSPLALPPHQGEEQWHQHAGAAEIALEGFYGLDS